MQAITFIEIEVPHCSLTYSVLPCMATLTGSPPTGTIKCFNSLGTCQDRIHFTNSPITLRFGEDIGIPNNTGFFSEILDENNQPLRDENNRIIYDQIVNADPLNVPDCFPLIKEIDYQPAIVSLNGELGQRASLKVIFKDALHSDAGPRFDKYKPDRDYNDPYLRGTFWGKFRARNPFLRGYAMRLIRGKVGQSLNEMETRHFQINSIDGPDATGDFSITAQDILKFADGDRSVAPFLSAGFLSGDISNSIGTATLAPTGIGDSEYPSSGYLAIGGKEIVSFTRVSDTLTITRGQLNTEAIAHSSQDRVQVILRYAAADPADIIADLLETYAGISPSYIPLSDWRAETAGFLGNVFTLNICEPTPVKDIIGELLTQIGGAIWYDDLDQNVHLQILRAISTNSQRFNEDNSLADSLSIREQPEKRVSQVIVYFGQINPLAKVDDQSNYRSTESEVDEQSELDEGSAAIKTIFARGIAQGGRTIASRIAQKHLSRFVRPPRRFNFEVPKFVGQTPHLGTGIRIGGGTPSIPSWPLQDETGNRIDAAVQITRHESGDVKHIIEAEEVLFTQYGSDAIDLTDKTIVLDASETNVNLRTRHDELFSTPNSGDSITCIIAAGIIIGSTDILIPGLNIGDWPVTSPPITISLVLRGRIEGKGGAGGGTLSLSGGAGGLALYTRQSIELSFDGGQIWGGGGGGGAGTFFNTEEWAGGGGGAGHLPGIGGSISGHTGSDGGSDNGGAAAVLSSAGSGGGPGLPGNSGNVAAGGSAGIAIDGVGQITFNGSGDIRGSQIN